MGRIGIVLSPFLLCFAGWTGVWARPTADQPRRATLKAVRWSQEGKGLEVLIVASTSSSFAMSWDLRRSSVRLELARVDVGDYPRSSFDIERFGVRRIRVDETAEGGTAVSVDFVSIPRGELRVQPVDEGLLLTIPPPSAGVAEQTVGDGTPESRDIGLLEKRLAELEKRVAMTEQQVARVTPPSSLPPPGLAGATASKSPVPSPSVAGSTAAAVGLQTPPAQSSGTPDLIPAEVRPVYPNLKFAGFSNLDYAASQHDQHGNGFRSGQFVLQLTSPLSDRVQVFGELALTAHETDFSASVERYILSISQSDALRLSFGRFHTPISWWNTEFHHGLWLQTSIERPYMVNFGTRFLPIHAVGAFAGGRIPSAPINLEYEVGVGNGRARDLTEPAQAGDVNNHRSVVFRIAAHPGDFSWLSAGASFYDDELNLPGLPDYRERITSAYLVWTKETPEIITELFHVRHTQIGAANGFTSWAGYGQIAYRLPWLNYGLKPYVRYERTQVNENDPVFEGFPGLTAAIVGLRYDFTLFAALKAEFQRRKSRDKNPYNAGLMQIAFTF
ncbi:MAG: hypothetical protein P8020_00820 [Acidobacteriota bacterium]